MSDSTKGDLLRFAPSNWLNRVRLGILLRLWFVLLCIVIIFIAEFAAANLWGQWAYFGLGWMQVPLLLFSCFLITAQEPRTALLEQGITLRRAIRWCAVIYCVYIVVASWGQLIIHPYLFELMKYVLGLSPLIVTLGELVLFRRYALRAPNIRLARSSRNCFRVLLPSGLIPILFNIVTVLFDAMTIRPDILATLFTAMQVIQVLCLLILLLVCVPWYLWIYGRCYMMFREAVRVARSAEAKSQTE